MPGALQMLLWFVDNSDIPQLVSGHCIKATMGVLESQSCYFAGAQAFSRATFGRGVGSIVLDQVGCSGTEARLFLCPSNPIGVHDCSHFEDAGVRCRNSSIGKDRQKTTKLQ